MRKVPVKYCAVQCHTTPSVRPPMHNLADRSPFRKRNTICPCGKINTEFSRLLRTGRRVVPAEVAEFVCAVRYQHNGRVAGVAGADNGDEPAIVVGQPVVLR